jgi:hypothetical protein
MMDLTSERLRTVEESARRTDNSHSTFMVAISGKNFDLENGETKEREQMSGTHDILTGQVSGEPKS